MRKWFVAAVAAVLCAGVLRGQGKISFEDGENWQSHIGAGGAVMEIVGEHAVDGAKSFDAERGRIAFNFINDGVVFRIQWRFIAVKVDDGGASGDTDENDHGILLCAVEIPAGDEEVAVCGAENEGVYLRAEIHFGEICGLCI